MSGLKRKILTEQMLNTCFRRHFHDADEAERDDAVDRERGARRQVQACEAMGRAVREDLVPEGECAQWLRTAYQEAPAGAGHALLYTHQGRRHGQ